MDESGRIYGIATAERAVESPARQNPEGHHGLPLLRLILDDVTQSKKTEIALRQAVLEKESLLKEIHHRVKNNFQVISSLLRLERLRSTDAATRTTLKEMQGRILSMALLHETLYRTSDFGGVEMAAYLRLLATHLFRAQTIGPEVRLTMDLAPTVLPIDQAVPCGLIVNELLANSLKHAFVGGRAGEVKVTLQTADGRVRLEVRDTGVGIPADLNQRKSLSLGLQLVSDLARQLGGALVVGPAPSPVFAVTFPLTPPTEPPIPPSKL